MRLPPAVYWLLWGKKNGVLKTPGGRFGALLIYRYQYINPYNTFPKKFFNLSFFGFAKNSSGAFSSTK